MKKNMLIYIFSFIIVIANGGPVWVIMIASNSKRITPILFHCKCISSFTTLANLEKYHSIISGHVKRNADGRGNLYGKVMIVETGSI